MPAVKTWSLRLLQELDRRIFHSQGAQWVVSNFKKKLVVFIGFLWKVLDMIWYIDIWYMICDIYIYIDIVWLISVVLNNCDIPLYWVGGSELWVFFFFPSPDPSLDICRCLINHWKVMDCYFGKLLVLLVIGSHNIFCIFHYCIFQWCAWICDGLPRLQECCSGSSVVFLGLTLLFSMVVSNWAKSLLFLGCSTMVWGPVFGCLLWPICFVLSAVV